MDMAKEYQERQANGEDIAITTLLQDIMNSLLKAQRELFLQENKDNSANGFYNRNINLSIGKIKLKVPRVRFGQTFRPTLLPEKWKRVDKDYENILLSLLANGYSKSQIKTTLKNLSLPYNDEALATLTDLIYDHLDFYKTQPIDGEFFAVIIDAHPSKARNEQKHIVPVSIFTAVGISVYGQKQILGWWTKYGKENLSFWNEVLQDLAARGLSKTALFITDDFNGLSNLIAKYFPFAQHQLCWVHFKRNLRKHCTSVTYRKIKNILNTIKYMDNQDSAIPLWHQCLALIEQEKPEISHYYNKKTDNFLAFLNWPEPIRKYIYTTNAAENINSGLELMRLELGGFFPSQKTLDVNLFIQMSNLNDNWMRKPIPLIKAHSFRIKQLLEIQYQQDIEQLTSSQISLPSLQNLLYTKT